jgi:hypothetical protein
VFVEGNLFPVGARLRTVGYRAVQPVGQQSEVADRVDEASLLAAVTVPGSGQ